MQPMGSNNFGPSTSQTVTISEMHCKDQPNGSVYLGELRKSNSQMLEISIRDEKYPEDTEALIDGFQKRQRELTQKLFRGT